MAGSEDRKRLLVSRLVSAGVPRAIALLWQVTGTNQTGNKFPYTYKHPTVPGVHHSLTIAKTAHIKFWTTTRQQPARQPARQPPAPQQQAPQQSAAVNNLAAAWWNGAPGVAIAADMRDKLWAVTVNHSDFKARPDPPVADWHATALVEKHGFRKLSRSSVVIDRATNRVLAVFATGADVPRLRDIASLGGDVYSLLGAHMIENRRRQGISMFGLRYNKHTDGTCPNTMRTGYYAAKSRESAIQLNRDPRLRKAVVPMVQGMCEVERLIAPAMGAHRLAHANDIKHPGIIPGEVSRAACPATACGVSRAYVSKCHTDTGFAGMSETIVWSSAGVDPSAGYSFAVIDAGVVFDLTADVATMVMVPGELRHGTLRLKPGCCPDHSGIGVVILNKANLLRPDALKDIEEINRRVASHTTCNPWLQAFVCNDEYDATVCKCCGKGDREHLLFMCDECNDGYHTTCLGMKKRPRSEDKWFCPSCCAVIMQERA